MNPLDRLEEIVEALRVFGDEENAAWLGQAVQQHLRNAVPLDLALGLKVDSKGRSARFQRLRREVADHLRTALQYCDGNLSRLGSVVSAYDRRKSFACLPQASSHDLQRAIRNAFATGLTVPKSGQSIGRLLRSEPK